MRPTWIVPVVVALPMLIAQPAPAQAPEEREEVIREVMTKLDQLRLFVLQCSAARDAAEGAQQATREWAGDREAGQRYGYSRYELRALVMEQLAAHRERQQTMSCAEIVARERGGLEAVLASPLEIDREVVKRRAARATLERELDRELERLADRLKDTAELVVGAGPGDYERIRRAADDLHGQVEAFRVRYAARMVRSDQRGAWEAVLRNAGTLREALALRSRERNAADYIAWLERWRDDQQERLTKASTIVDHAMLSATRLNIEHARWEHRDRLRDIGDHEGAERRMLVELAQLVSRPR